MKSALPFFALVLVFTSCTTAYKSGQTPDDVYYSPARPQAEYIARNDRQDEYLSQNNRQDRYQYDEQNEDDRYLRMKVRNRRTWSDLDYYYSDPYAYNYRYRLNTYNNIYYNTPWDHYSSWNYYYNPYNNYYNPYYSNMYGRRPQVIVVNPKQPAYNQPRRFNLNTYTPSVNTNPYSPKSSSPRRVYRGDNRGYDYNTNNSSNASNDRGSLRNTFNNNNSSQTTTAPSRSDRSNSTPSASPSRSTNAPTRKF